MKKKFNPFQAIKGLARRNGFFPSVRATFMTLAVHADEDGKCSLTIKSITEHNGLSRAQVYRALKKLQEVGAISVRRSRWNNVYKINSDWWGDNPQGAGLIRIHPVKETGDFIIEVAT